LVSACKGDVIRKSHIVDSQLSLLNEELSHITGNYRWVQRRKFMVFSDHHADWVNTFWFREQAEEYAGHLLTHNPHASVIIREA
jgi:hypothetical protein